MSRMRFGTLHPPLSSWTPGLLHLPLLLFLGPRLLLGPQSSAPSTLHPPPPSGSYPQSLRFSGNSGSGLSCDLETET
eukprot:3012237-Pyramimonas_sp.AAC.1